MKTIELEKILDKIYEDNYSHILFHINEKVKSLIIECMRQSAEEAIEMMAEYGDCTDIDLTEVKEHINARYWESSNPEY